VLRGRLNNPTNPGNGSQDQQIARPNQEERAAVFCRVWLP
jgi:hypothetical protein